MLQIEAFCCSVSPEKHGGPVHPLYLHFPPLRSLPLRLMMCSVEWAACSPCYAHLQQGNIMNLTMATQPECPLPPSPDACPECVYQAETQEQPLPNILLQLCLLLAQEGKLGDGPRLEGVIAALRDGREFGGLGLRVRAEVATAGCGCDKTEDRVKGSGLGF